MMPDNHHAQAFNSMREVRVLLDQAGKNLTALAVRYDAALAELESSKDSRCDAMEAEERGDSVESHVRGYKADLVTEKALTIATSFPRSMSVYRDPEELLKEAAWSVDEALKHLSKLKQLADNQAGP